MGCSCLVPASCQQGCAQGKSQSDVTLQSWLNDFPSCCVYSSLIKNKTLKTKEKQELE